jgi:hypothetical protein
MLTYRQSNLLLIYVIYIFNVNNECNVKKDGNDVERKE